MEKIKQFLVSDRGKSIFTVGIIILASTGSFLLGRLSKDSSSGIKIEYPKVLSLTSTPEEIAQAATVSSAENTTTTPSTAKVAPSSKSFFASNRGSKYYPSGCSAGKTIKMENRVYFSTRAAAEAAGYTLSASCN